MKRCTECGEEKPLDQFPLSSKRRKDGTRYSYERSACKACTNMRAKKLAEQRRLRNENQP